jgi:hypothetical protein
MTNIVIPTTLVADTGTGATMTPYNMAGNSAVYRESSPTGAPAKLTMKRTDAIPSGGYAGAGKAEIKFTRQVEDTLGRLWPVVYTVTTSIPAFMEDTDKSAFVDEATAALGLAVSRDALAKLLIPQS